MLRHLFKTHLLILTFFMAAGSLFAQTYSATLSTTPACSLDGTATVTVVGGVPPYNYHWYTVSGNQTTTTPTITGLVGGYIYVYVYDQNSALAYAGTTVGSPFTFDVNATNEVCGDGSGTASATILSGGTPPFTYAWSNGMTGPTITGLHTGNYEITITDANGCFVASNLDSNLIAFVGNSSPISFQVNTTNSLCNDGTASVANLLGGTAPYSFFWNMTPPQYTQTISNVPGNTWGTVEVSDAAGCVTTDYFYVGQGPNGLGLSITKTNETCIQANGTAAATITGGTPPYTYLWSNGATTSSIGGLSYGNYSVTVTDANSCPKSGSVFIQRTDPLNLSFTRVNPNCLNTGGALTVNVSGGTAPYTYAWMSGATTSSISNLSVGYYSVTVTDANGCYDHSFTYLDMQGNCYGNISGSVFADPNANCVIDGPDFPFANRMVSFGNTYAVTNGGGFYSKNVLPGNYTITQPTPPNYFAQNCPVSPASYTVSNLLPQQQVANLDFFNLASSNVDDLLIGVSYSPARPTANQGVWLYYSNVGSTVQNATIEFVHDPLMSLVSGGWALSNYNLSSRTLTYNLGPLHPQESGNIYISFSIPTNTVLGTPYTHTARILPISNDVAPADNVRIISDSVVTAYDPNDKAVYPAGPITLDDSVLTYTIRFQNTGNDTAFTVAIRDTIDPSLDIFSLEVLGASHAYVLDADAPNVAIFKFDNIMLPDSNINEPLSHGHIVYRIHTKPNLSLGIDIKNSAAIYFDYNAPVITNTVVSPLGLVAVQDPQSTSITAFSLYPNPASQSVNIMLNDNWRDLTEVTVRDLSGRVMYKAAIAPSADRTLKMDLQDLARGIYLVECQNEGQRQVRKLILQ